MSLDSILFRKPPSTWEKLIFSPVQFLAHRTYSLYCRGTDTPADPLGITVVCVSDTHNSHASIPPLPPGDILIHAGDLTQSGTEDELHSVLVWLTAQQHPHKIFVAGNHDRALSYKILNSVPLLHESTPL